MNVNEINEFKKKLQTLKSELVSIEESGKSMADVVELDQTKVGRISRMDAMQSQQMALETSRRRLQTIQKIEGALLRIEVGEFGSCFVCGENLSIERLHADPTCTRCVCCVD